MADKVKVTPEEWADGLIEGVRRSGPKMEKGILAVTEAPGVRAARAKSNWVNKLADTRVQDKWAKNVAKMPLDEWQRLMIEKGVARAQTGVVAAKDKIVAAATALITHQNTGLGKLAAMPKVTLAQSGDRMLFWMNHMAKYQAP